MAARAAMIGADVEVPCVDGRMRRYVNLDYAASTPAMVGVLARRRGVPAVVQQRAPRQRLQVAAGDRGLRGRARGGGRVRRRRATGRSCSCATRPRRSTCSRPRCRRARRVLSTAVEHHANMLPWRRHDLTVLPVPGSAWELVERCEHALRVAQPADRPGRRHRRLERHGRGVAAGRARGGRPSLRRRAVRRRRPARSPPRDRHGGHGDRLPRALRAQALRAVRGRRARRPRARPRARRAAAARRRGDRPRHARRRHLGRGARAPRDGLAERRRRGRARRGVPDPGRSSAWTASRPTSARWPRAWRRVWRGCPASSRWRCGAIRPSTASAWRPSTSRATATRCWPRSSAPSTHRRAPRLLLRPSAAHRPARRARGRARSHPRRDARRRAAAAARGGAGQLRARHHGAGRRPAGRRPGQIARCGPRWGYLHDARARRVPPGTRGARAAADARATRRRPPARRRGR